MSRRVFYSFHYKPDAWRVSKVRNIGAIEDNKPCTDNDWESVTNGGDAAIRKWIDTQMQGRTCTVVLIGANTAGRKWINYEIAESWNRKMGVFGVHVHRITGSDLQPCARGGNPFNFVTIGSQYLSSIVPVYDPPYSNSPDVYQYVSSHLETWIEHAISVRHSFRAAA